MIVGVMGKIPDFAFCKLLETEMKKTDKNDEIEAKLAIKLSLRTIHLLRTQNFPKN